MTEQPILWWLAHNTIFAAILTAIVYGACRLFSLRPAIRHILWLMVLIKLATPPVLNWPWQAKWLDGLAVSPCLEEPNHNPPVDAERFAFSNGQHEWLSLPNGLTSKILPGDAGPDHEEFVWVPTNSEIPNRDLSKGHESQSAVQPPYWQSSRFWTWMVIAVWAAAGLGMAGLQALRVYRFRRRVISAIRASGPLADQVSVSAQQLGLPVPRTLIASDIASPMVWGLGRPTLLWPASLVGRLSPTCQQAVIVHELAHLRRRDHWISWLQLLAGCIWWWHPLYRYVSRQVRANAELACDAWVVNVMPAARRAYAEALLEVSQHLPPHAAPMPVLGMAVGRLDLERRLVMIMRDSASCKLSVRSLVILGAVALITLPGWSLSKQPGDDDADDDLVVEMQKDGDENEANEFEFKLDNLDLSAMEMVDSEGDEDDVAQPKGQDADRLDRLEKQLQLLQKEVKSLRAAKGDKSTQSQAKGWAEVILKDRQPKKIWESSTIAKDGWNPVLIQKGHDKEVTLIRATYKMPQPKAEALARFLRDQLKDQALETAVQENAIVITAQPEVQKTISQFIGLVQGKKVALELFQEKPGAN